MARTKGVAEEIDGFTLDFLEASEQSVRAATALTWEAIIDGWPVKEGRSRANWFATNKVPSEATTSKTDKTGVTTKNKAIKQVMSVNDWSSFYLSNNLPYSYVIEMGGYPDPVKLGTRQKDGSYKQFSKSGYSKQAPSGAVRLNMKKSERLLTIEAKKRLSKL